jgi:anti-anti-sigma factor
MSSPVEVRPQHEPDPRYLTVQDAVAGTDHTLALTGELDLASASNLEGIIEADVHDARAITLDLRGLSFMDSCGLRAVLNTRKVCETRAYDFALIPG